MSREIGVFEAQGASTTAACLNSLRGRTDSIARKGRMAVPSAQFPSARDRRRNQLLHLHDARDRQPWRFALCSRAKPVTHVFTVVLFYFVEAPVRDAFKVRLRTRTSAIQGRNKRGADAEHAPEAC